MKEPGTGGEDNTADDTITSLVTVDFGVTDPEGVAYAPGLDHLFIADGVKRDLRAVAWELSETEAV